ncbi:MAG: helix-turn-helix transcriptional regulator [Neisseriaceae bacterium]|nr:helix-turn-helix transcriptional regulator [Neisseriaceae bacterium]
MQTEQEKYSLEEQSQVVVDFLKNLCNVYRLQILCLLMERGEMCVNHLREKTGDGKLTHSAISQHLTRMREDGLLTSRRDAQECYYKVSDEKVIQIMTTLKEIFCSQQ